MASDFILEIDGIKGESKDDKYPDAIDIDTFIWTARNGGTYASGGGGGAGKVSMEDIQFTAGVNKASPEIMLACASGKHIKKAVLHVRKQGGEQEEYYRITLEDILISHYSSGFSDEEDTETEPSRPTDSFALNFSKITFDYKPQAADGTLGSAVTTGWNLKKNVKV